MEQAPALLESTMGGLRDFVRVSHNRSPEPVLRADAGPGLCRVADCARAPFSRGVCKTHYNQLHHGSWQIKAEEILLPPQFRIPSLSWADGTTLPLDFPPLLLFTDQQEERRHAVWSLVSAEEGMGTAMPWASYRAHNSRGLRAARRLLCDLTLVENQATWLTWLAVKVGVPVPPVGCPSWRRLEWRGCVVYRLGEADAGHYFWFGPTETPEADITECPSLSDPDSDDASIRALVVALLKVGGVE